MLQEGNHGCQVRAEHAGAHCGQSQATQPHACPQFDGLLSPQPLPGEVPALCILHSALKLMTCAAWGECSMEWGLRGAVLHQDF